MNRILIEAGATITTAFARAHLLDEWHWFIAPMILGSDAQPAIAPLQRQQIITSEWKIMQQQSFADNIYQQWVYSSPIIIESASV